MRKQKHVKARERAAQKTKLAQNSKMFTTTGRITAVILAGIILCTSAYTISFASIVSYDAAMKFVTSEETEYQKKQTELDASDLYFTGDEIKIDELLSKNQPINMVQMNKNGRCKRSGDSVWAFLQRKRREYMGLYIRQL